MMSGKTFPASRSASSCTQRSWNVWPPSVSDRRRVVRLSSRTSRCCSSSAICRETAEVDRPRRSAARAKLPPEQYERMRAEMLELFRRHNAAGDGSLRIEAEYLVTVARRRG